MNESKTISVAELVAEFQLCCDSWVKHIDWMRDLAWDDPAERARNVFEFTAHSYQRLCGQRFLLSLALRNSPCAMADVSKAFTHASHAIIGTLHTLRAGVESNATYNEKPHAVAVKADIDRMVKSINTGIRTYGAEETEPESDDSESEAEGSEEKEDG